MQVSAERKRMEKGREEELMAAPEQARITVADRDGGEVELYVLEETKINGMYYLLAAEGAEGDGACYILKDVSGPEEREAVYEFVEDDAEADYMLRIFQELMSDSGVELI